MWYGTGRVYGSENLCVRAVHVQCRASDIVSFGLYLYRHQTMRNGGLIMKRTRHNQINVARQNN